MPTQPIDSILPRSIEPGEFQELINLISTTLDELVSYGTQVIHWVAHNPKFKQPDINVPLLLLTRHIVELVDSISILVKKSSIDPCKIILRSALETMLYIIFITKEKCEDRSKAYLVTYIKNKKNEYLKFKRGTQLHKDFRNKIKNDQLISEGFNPFSQILDDQLQKKIENLDRLISKPIFSETKTEYNRTKKKYNKKPPWYLLYNGAESIEKLAEILNYRYLYEVAYRRWSSTVHASDVITGKVAKSDQGKGSFYQIRLGVDVSQVATFTINIVLTSYRTLINFIVPEMNENLSNWYRKEIRDSLSRIMKTKIILSE